MPRSLDERLNSDIGQLRIDGLDRTIRSLKAAGADAADLRDVFHGIGMVVAEEAQRLAPVKSGRLRGSVKAKKARTSAEIKAGGARVPYAGVHEYGWPAHNIEESGFMRGAIGNKSDEVLQKFEDGFTTMLEKHGLL